VNLLPNEAAERLRVSKGTLANWRCAETGPAYVKLGRMILYPEVELAAFEQANLVSTSNAGRTGDR
jgi:hypothetical protein